MPKKSRKTEAEAYCQYCGKKIYRFDGKWTHGTFGDVKAKKHTSIFFRHYDSGHDAVPNEGTIIYLEKE